MPTSIDQAQKRRLFHSVIDDLNLCVKHNRGDTIQEDYSCDSEFMLRKVREINAKTRACFFEQVRA